MAGLKVGYFVCCFVGKAGILKDHRISPSPGSFRAELVFERVEGAFDRLDWR